MQSQVLLVSTHGKYSYHAESMLTQQLKHCTTQQWLKEFYSSLAFMQ